MSTIDVNKIRKDFPILKRTFGSTAIPLIYFDNAATSQTPIQVINSITEYYTTYNSNIHRGVHRLSQEATNAYEEARKTLQRHFNTKKHFEIVFTSGTTYAINLLASSFRHLLSQGDEIIISWAEHHSNIVPWQMICEQTGAKLRIIPISKEGELDMKVYEELLNSRTKIVCCSHISNSLGVINPIKEIIDKAHSLGAAVLIDGAQACPHTQVDVQKLDVDFYVGSAHKMYGPTGIGFLYGKEQWLEKLPPYQGGGEMIDQVTFDKTTYAKLPYKFEAGTPNIAGVIAFGVAIDYINSIGISNIATYENELLNYTNKKLSQIEDIELYANNTHKTAIVSFNLKGIHSYDVGAILDQMGIAIRTGHHCAQPVMDFYQITGTARVSFAIYNTTEEVDTFIKGLLKAKKMLS